MLKFFNGFLVLSSGAMIIQDVSKYRKYFPYEYFLSFRRFFFFILLTRIKVTANKNKRNLFHSGEGFLRLLCKKFTTTMSWLDGINFSALLARTTRRVMKMLIHKCLKRLPGRIRRMLNLLRLSSSAMNVSCAWIYAAFGIQLSLQNRKLFAKRWYSKNFSTKTV